VAAELAPTGKGLSLILHDGIPICTVKAAEIDFLWFAAVTPNRTVVS
jgi:hypothetical protein